MSLDASLAPEDPGQSLVEASCNDMKKSEPSEVKIVCSLRGMVFWRTCRGGGMADATDLKSVDRKVVRVRLPPSAPIGSITYRHSSFESEFRYGVKSVAHTVFGQIAQEIDAHVLFASPSSIRLGIATVGKSLELH